MMTANDKNLLKQMIKSGKFDAELAGFLQEKIQQDAKAMIKKMGPKHCLHPSNAPVKGNYGI